MSDRKLKYFYDCEIAGPNGEILISLKEKVDLKGRDWRNSIDDLIFFIKEYPNRALMNEEVSYKLTMLRQQAAKDSKAGDIWKKVCKALRGHSGRRRNKEKLWINTI